MHRFSAVGLALLALLLAAVPTGAETDRLVGPWKAVTYVMEGKDHPVEGLFIFTPRYYSANIRFTAQRGAVDAANGNAGPYTADRNQIVFTQWVQIHVRPEAPEHERILSRRGPDEVTKYSFEENRLILTFPSGNRYVLERIQE